MTEILETLQSARFVLDQDGQATDVILSLDVWEILLRWLEDIEDRQTVKAGLARLKAAQNDLQKASLIPWETVEVELDALDEVEQNVSLIRWSCCTTAFEDIAR